MNLAIKAGGGGGGVWNSGSGLPGQNRPGRTVDSPYGPPRRTVNRPVCGRDIVQIFRRLERGNLDRGEAEEEEEEKERTEKRRSSGGGGGGAWDPKEEQQQQEALKTYSKGGFFLFGINHAPLRPRCTGNAEECGAAGPPRPGPEGWPKVCLPSAIGRPAPPDGGSRYL